MFELHGPAPIPGRPLVVVAVIDEARAFLDRYPVLVTGVGKVRGATATSWAVLTHRPSVVLNVGTAGALRAASEVAMGVVHEIGTVLQHDLNGRAIAELTGADPGPPLVLGASPIVLATGDRFVSSPEVRDRLAALAHLVDMEGYAVATAATGLGVPVRLAKVVSDDAGHGAALSWVDALHAASHLLGAWLDDVIGPAAR